MRKILAATTLTALLCACSGAKTEPETAAPAPAPSPLTEQEILSRFEQTVPKMKTCFEQTPAPAGGKYPRTARVSFAYTSDEQGLVKEARVIKANFRFKTVGPCLEHQLEGLQLSPAGSEERRISLKIDLKK